MPDSLCPTCGCSWDAHEFGAPTPYCPKPCTEAETCIVCGGPEPCSHDFDKLNADLEALGSRMGSGNQDSGLRIKGCRKGLTPMPNPDTSPHVAGGWVA